MRTRRNRILFMIVAVLASAVLATGESRAAVVGSAVALECSPCTNDDGEHDWTLACCFGTSDCYMYPDAQQNNNPGSCQGMHRPCNIEE